LVFFFSSRRRHTSSTRDWSSDVCSSDLEPYARHHTPRFYAPHWLSFLTACASETAAKLSPNRTPFVTRESVQMSRRPHFSSNAKAEKELGYIPTSSMDHAIHDAVEDFVARGLATVAAGRLRCRVTA